jgi:hypothetical protein
MFENFGGVCFPKMVIEADSYSTPKPVSRAFSPEDRIVSVPEDDIAVYYNKSISKLSR